MFNQGGKNCLNFTFMFFIQLYWYETNQQTRVTVEHVLDCYMCLLYEFCKIWDFWCLYMWGSAEPAVDSYHTTRHHVTAGSDIVEILFTVARVCLLGVLDSKHLRNRKLKPKQGNDTDYPKDGCVKPLRNVGTHLTIYSDTEISGPWSK